MDIWRDESLTPNQKYAKLFQTFSTTREAYRKYIACGDWRTKRSAKFAKVGKKCEICFTSEKTAKLEVHHINYKFLFDCELEDLKVLCQKCHSSEHRRIKNGKPITRRTDLIDGAQKGFFGPQKV